MALGSSLQVSPASANDTWYLVVSFCGSLLQIESEGLPHGFRAFSKSSDVREKEAHFLTWAQPVTVLGQRLRPQALLCHHCSSTAHLTCRTKGMHVKLAASSSVTVGIAAS